MDVNLFEAQPVPSAIWPRELGDNLRAFATAVRAVLLDAELPRDVFVGWARASLTCSETTWRWRRRASFLPGCERALTADDWSELAASVPRVLDHLHGGADESKYESLRRNILAWDARTGWLKSSTNLRGCPASVPIRKIRRVDQGE
jgi:hypothetical protein